MNARRERRYFADHPDVQSANRVMAESVQLALSFREFGGLSLNEEVAVCFIFSTCVSEIPGWIRRRDQLHFHIRQLRLVLGNPCHQRHVPCRNCTCESCIQIRSSFNNEYYYYRCIAEVVNNLRDAQSLLEPIHQQIR